MIADRLRKAVLQAAIQGKLTEQMPEDGDARDLLQEIRAEKERLIQKGKVTKEKSLPVITEEKIPFDIPDNWCWCYLQDIAKKIHYGFTAPAQSTGSTKMLRITDIQDNFVDWKKVPYCKISDDQLPSYILKNRDIVIARTGGTVGKTFIINDIRQDSVFASYLIRVVLFNEVYENYVKFFMESELYWMQLKDKSQGTGQPNVNGQALKVLLLPLPPLEEQHRIVEKLEQILPEIDTLSGDEIKLDSLQQSFPGQMKSSILQAAIQGKLTEQLPEDGDARDLLEVIKAEKDQLIKEGKIKKEKPLPEVTEEEIPFDIPENWVWCRLGEVTNYGFGRQVNKEKIPPNSWILELEDIEKDSYILRKKIFDRKPGSSKNKFFKGEVLYGKLRPYLKKVIIADEEGFCTTEIIPFKSFGDWIIPSYLKYFIVSPSTDYLINQITHGMDMPRLGTDKARKLIIPLPPHAEQHRIVVRLKELLPFCDSLDD